MHNCCPYLLTIGRSALTSGGSSLTTRATSYQQYIFQTKLYSLLIQSWDSFFVAKRWFVVRLYKIEFYPLYFIVESKVVPEGSLHTDWSSWHNRRLQRVVIYLHFLRVLPVVHKSKNIIGRYIYTHSTLLKMIKTNGIFGSDWWTVVF